MAALRMRSKICNKLITLIIQYTVVVDICHVPQNVFLVIIIIIIIIIITVNYLFFAATASNVKRAGSSVSTRQLHVLKMERAECERLLNLHGKPRQFVVRESKKVKVFALHIWLNTIVFSSV